MKPILFILLFLTASLNLNAQLLWEVSGNGLEKPSYVYGTVHVGDNRAYQFIDDIKPKLQSCDIMAGELDLDMSIFQNFSMLMSLFMPNDTTLKDLLTKEEYSLVKRKLDKKLYNMGLIGMAEIMEKIKPTFTSMFLTDLNTLSDMNSGQPALDLYLQQEARKAGKQVIGLETVDEQMGTFDKIPLKKQAQALYEELAAEGGSNSAEMLERMLDLYAEGNLDSLYAISTTEMDAEMIESFLNLRNHNMANRMVPYLDKGKTMFVAVGAAHLLGEEGVLELLRKKGYTVKAVEEK